MNWFDKRVADAQRRVNERPQWMKDTTMHHTLEDLVKYWDDAVNSRKKHRKPHKAEGWCGKCIEKEYPNAKFQGGTVTTMLCTNCNEKEFIAPLSDYTGIPDVRYVWD